MPSSFQQHAPFTDPWIQQDLISRHGLPAVAGGYLLTMGRRALNEYGDRRNFDLWIVNSLLAETVAAWCESQQVNRSAVEESAAALDLQFLAQDYETPTRKF